SAMSPPKVSPPRWPRLSGNCGERFPGAARRAVLAECRRYPSRGEAQPKAVTPLFTSAIESYLRATVDNQSGPRWRSNPRAVRQVTCRHEWDLETYSQLSRVLSQLCTVIDDAAQTPIVALSVPLDQELHPVGEVL